MLNMISVDLPILIVKMGNTGITYSIVGPGSSYDNRIKVTVGCGEISAIICYIGRSKFFDGCNYHITDTKICEEVAAPSDGGVIEGTLTWNGQTVYYEVTVECPDTPDPNCVYRCDNNYVKSWATPYYITDDTTEIDVYYEYRKIGTDTNTGELCGVIKKSGHKKVSPTTTSFSVDGCTIPVNTEKKKSDDCTPGTVVTLSVYFTPSVVPASGGTITVNVAFKKVVTDKNCVKKETSGGWGFPWTVTCEATTEDPYKCCVDHMVTGTLAISEIRTKLKLDNDTKIVYNGVDVSNEENIEYSVLQKAKYTDECSGFCEEKTTYCADQSSVKVCYEKEWMSNEWICEGETTDCDCSALSIDGVNGYLSVPFTGGRIKVTWDYSAHTTTRDCQEFDSTGKWEEIIAIGGCDERPTDCNPEYNKVIINAQGGTGVYDNDTYQGCEICDSECCYNYDGNGKCKCVILFKERTPECKGKTEGGCDEITIYDNQLGREVTYNKIHYEFVQDCTPDCEYNRYINYDKQEHTLAKCFEGSTSYTVSYTAITEYEGIGCPADTSTPGSEVVSLVVKKNNSRSEKIVYDDERLKVVQEKGPCDDETTCDCDALSVEGGSCVDRIVYEDVHVDCNEHVNEHKTVHYKVMCDQEIKSEGDTAITISLACNSGIERQYTIDGVTVYQAGGCDCGQPTSCSCTGHSIYGTSNHYPADGSTEKVQIGSLDLGSDCSNVSFVKTVIKEGTRSIWTLASEVEVRSNGQVWAKVPANNTTDVCRVHVVFNCNEEGSSEDGKGYFNFYQEAGSSEICTCSEGSRYVGGGGTGIYGGNCPANGFGVREKPYVIGYYTSGDCTKLPTFTIVPSQQSTVDLNTFMALWSNVSTGLTTTEPQYDETGIYTSSHELPRKSDFNPPITHYVTASTIPANPYGYLNMHFTPSCHKNHYFTFQQDGGGTTVCDVTSDSTLDGYVSKFNSALGTTISTGNTPCTYKYLKAAYATVSGTNATTIMWTLANVMSELTPKNTMCEKYFKAASASEYGGIPSVSDTTKSVYENRINGGVAYALFKHNIYEASKVMVDDARRELRSKGIAAATWGTDNDCGDMCWSNNYETLTSAAPNPISIIPNMWGDKSTTSYDYTAMATLVQTYPTVESTKNIDGTDYVPLKDKQACNLYLAKIMGLPETTEWANFIYDSTDVAIASGNIAKRKAYTKRPANEQYPLFNYLCDNTIEDPGRAYCDDDCGSHHAYDPEFCNCETADFQTSVASYPSGHTFKAFMSLLAVIIADGDSGNKVDRMTKYCYHRNVVRAHWHSDVLIGKLVATIDIGYLCGYKQFQDRVDDLI